MKHFYIVFAAVFTIAAAHPAGAAAPPTVEAVLGAVVALRAEIAPGARTAETLGTQRDGHGVVIDSDGLVLTIGYLILEAESVTVAASDGAPVPARILAYDHATGFGLLRAERKLDVRPMALADSADAATPTAGCSGSARCSSTTPWARVSIARETCSCRSTC